MSSPETMTLSNTPPTPERVDRDPMDPAHLMDWDPLHLGHKLSSKKTVHLTDMDVHVFGLEEIQGSDLPVAIIIVAHGWANKARHMEPFASGILGEVRRLDAEASGRKRTRDVLVATLDQRNHGDRRRVRTKMTFENNPLRLMESSMTLTGGKLDHQYLMDFLPDVLFPQGERKVVEFMSTGFSMGGHVGWRLLRDDARIRIAVPMCSIPTETLGKVLMARKLPPGSVESYVPEQTRSFFLDPPPPGCFRGKRILALHGGLDALIPWQWGNEDWEKVERETVEGGGGAARHVFEDVGHIVSKDMVTKAAEWFWFFGLTEEA